MINSSVIFSATEEYIFLQNHLFHQPFLETLLPPDVRDFIHKIFYSRYNFPNDLYEGICDFLVQSIKGLGNLAIDVNLFYLFLVNKELWQQPFYVLGNLINVYFIIILQITRLKNRIFWNFHFFRVVRSYFSCVFYGYNNSISFYIYLSLENVINDKLRFSVRINYIFKQIGKL